MWAVCYVGLIHRAQQPGYPQGPRAQDRSQPPQALSVQRLQRKLKEAARVVLRLRREKEQLLELGNRLRAQLGQPAGEPGWHGHRHALGLGGHVRGREGEQSPCPYPKGSQEPAHGPCVRRHRWPLELLRFV